MEIDIHKLHEVFEQLIKLWESKNATITIPADFYWHIPKELKYDTYIKPEEFTVGQLTDDWQELKKILSGETPPVEYAMVWLAAILRAVGEFGSD